MKIEKQKFFNLKYIIEAIVLLIFPYPGWDVEIRVKQTGGHKGEGELLIPYFGSELILIIMLVRFYYLNEIFTGK